MSITAAEFILLGIAAFALSGLLTWPVRALAINLGVMDLPNLERKTQKEPVPYLGGVSIALTIMIISYASVLYSDNTKTTFPLITYALIPAVLLGIMGLIDDLRGLQPLPRLFFQSAVGVIVAIFLSTQNLVGTPLDNPSLDKIVNIIWIVGICNSINFFDNLDGGGAGPGVAGGNGGSGVTYMSFPTGNYTGTITGLPTVTTSGGNTILRFTNSGTYTA